MNTMNKILIGTLSGMAAGVVIGMLTAPAKGKETREKLALQANKMKRRMEKFRNNPEAELEELEELFTHEVQGLKEDVRRKVLNLIESRRNRKVPEPSLS
jgi:gas vesicle protein